MPRSPRQCSTTDIYHVSARGVGKRIIFENDSNRYKFLGYIAAQQAKGHIKLYAWCFMTNHIHLLLKAEEADLSCAMHAICTGYANYYNTYHGHVGPVFQGRFSSIPVENENQFLATLRYIHLNPLDITDDIESYQWSSYPQYLGSEGICDTSLGYDYLKNVENIRSFHDSEKGRIYLVNTNNYRPRISDDEALSRVQNILGKSFVEGIPNMTKSDRDHAISRLYSLGLTGRQIGRLTGIGKSIIERAITEERKNFWSN